MDIYGQLDNLLGKIYGHTMSAEQTYVADSEFKDISVNDMLYCKKDGRDSRNIDNCD